MHALVACHARGHRPIVVDSPITSGRSPMVETNGLLLLDPISIALHVLIQCLVCQLELCPYVGPSFMEASAIWHCFLACVLKD